VETQLAFGNGNKKSRPSAFASGLALAFAFLVVILAEDLLPTPKLLVFLALHNAATLAEVDRATFIRRLQNGKPSTKNCPPNAGKGNRNRHLAAIFRHQGFIKA